MSDHPNTYHPPNIEHELGGPTYHVRKKIWVTFDKHGIHCYPNAPEEVKYLRDPHRHLFKFKVGISVYHDEREIEFHMLQNEITSWYDSGVLEFNFRSCESLAGDLLTKLKTAYPDRPYYSVEVSEDGECGAELVHEYYHGVL